MAADARALSCVGGYLAPEFTLSRSLLTTHISTGATAAARAVGRSGTRLTAAHARDTAEFASIAAAHGGRARARGCRVRAVARTAALFRPLPDVPGLRADVEDTRRSFYDDPELSYSVVGGKRARSGCARAGSAVTIPAAQ